mgnify:CR=1 FL=1
MAAFRVLTLNEVIIQKQSAFPYAKGELSRLLSHIGLAAKIVHKQVNKAGLVNILGEANKINVQGESQQKLDVYADDVFKKALQASGIVCGIASEENDEIIIFDDDLSLEGNYVVCIDPLDGSSNIDVNVSIGSIFSIYHRLTPEGSKATERLFATRHQTGGRRIYHLWLVDHAGVHHRIGNHRIYLRLVDWRVLPVEHLYGYPEIRKYLFD